MKLKADLLAKTYKDIQNYDKLKYIPTVSMYYGVSFKELELEAYSEESLKYLKDKLFILSALYGLLQAFDLVKKYRLDMTMSIVDKGLYNFWKKKITKKDFIIYFIYFFINVVLVYLSLIMIFLFFGSSSYV